MNIYKCIGCDHGPCFHRSEPDGCRFGCTDEKWSLISRGACKKCLGYGKIPPDTLYCKTCGRELPEQGGE